nr:MAG TPA: hypothetical protein [Caudoviricetes sp.]
MLPFGNVRAYIGNKNWAAGANTGGPHFKEVAA